jgi:hypothetical protein
MTHNISCFRCGASLAGLSLPFGRRDECPDCAIHLHVCKMCVNFSADIPRQCREDDAEEVMDKDKVNFCDWYKPSADAFDPARAGQVVKAQADLAALFGDETAESAAPDAALKDAEDLFN